MDKITLDMPFDLVKSRSNGEMRIGGYASTSDRDRQNETVMHKCLDISEFVTTGFFNLDHDGSKILGYPDASRCIIDNHGLYVEGTLLRGVPEAESVYRTAVALKKSNAPRKLGFSVEGQVLERNPNGLITKAKVYNVAITAQPVNPNCTWDAMCKSFVTCFAAEPECDAVQTYGQGMGTVENPIPYVQEARFDAGQGWGTEKALTTESGAALVPESLETAFRKLADIIGQDGEISAENLEVIRDMLRRSEQMNERDIALYLSLTRGLSLPDSIRLVRTKLKQGGRPA